MAMCQSPLFYLNHRYREQAPSHSQRVSSLSNPSSNRFSAP